jgi:xanthine dehydrogenase YagR molybdenum-binding subunit
MFVEVRADSDLGVVRVKRRLLGAYDIGRVVNQKLARSQALGGLIAGVGMALLKQADWDARTGHLMNPDLAEHLVPVCADIGSVDCLSSHEPTFTKLGGQKRGAARAY